MNYWYSARPNEIFLDLDSRKALFRAMKVLRVWQIPIKEIYHYPTTRDHHCHVIVVLGGMISGRMRAEMALWMGSDRLRACWVFARLTEQLIQCNADLLVTKRQYHRNPDATCRCRTKHKTKHITNKCPALKALLGEYRSHDWFPRVGAYRMSTIRIPEGKVPVELIRKWRKERVA